MKIKIPHLGYTIIVKDVSKYKGTENFRAYSNHDNNDQVTLYLSLKELNKKYYFPTVAHEVMHAIQFMSQDRNIDFAYEVENGGYLMNYICNEILGYSYDV